VLRLPVSCRRRRSARTRDPCSCGLNCTGSHVAHSVSHGERYRLSRQPHRSQTPGGAVEGSRRSTVFQKWPTFRQGSPRSCVTPCLQPMVIAAWLGRCQALRRRASQIARGRNIDTERAADSSSMRGVDRGLTGSTHPLGQVPRTKRSEGVGSGNDVASMAWARCGGSLGGGVGGCGDLAAGVGRWRGWRS